ncbi:MULTISPECIES: hypothetical protein [unclassified Streptomyces]
MGTPALVITAPDGAETLTCPHHADEAIHRALKTAPSVQVSAYTGN